MIAETCWSRSEITAPSCDRRTPAEPGRRRATRPSKPICSRREPPGQPDLGRSGDEWTLTALDRRRQELEPGGVTAQGGVPDLVCRPEYPAHPDRRRRGHGRLLKGRGVSWQITALAMPDPATPVTAFHRFGKLLLATSALGRFLISEDDGEELGPHAVEHQRILHRLRARSRTRRDRHDRPQWRRAAFADGGKSWEGSEIVLDGNKNFLCAIRFDERSGSLLVIGQGGTLARSTDGGEIWTRASADIHGDVRGLINDTTRNRLIAFGTGGMVLSSTDSGAQVESRSQRARSVAARNRRGAAWRCADRHRQARQTSFVRPMAARTGDAGRRPTRIRIRRPICAD